MLISSYSICRVPSWSPFVYTASEISDIGKMIKDQNSIRMSDFLINTSIPGTLYSNILTFKDSNKSFKLDGDLLETITNFDFNVDLSNQRDRKRTLWVWKRNEVWY